MQGFLSAIKKYTHCYPWLTKVRFTTKEIWVPSGIWKEQLEQWNILWLKLLEKKNFDLSANFGRQYFIQRVDFKFDIFEHPFQGRIQSKTKKLIITSMTSLQSVITWYLNSHSPLINVGYLNNLIEWLIFFRKGF